MSTTNNYLLTFLKGITVEPMFLMYYAATAIATYGSTNLLLQKACHPGDTTAPDYSAPCPDEIQAQKVLTVIGFWKPILEHALPVFLIVFLGTWSDTHGKRRRPLMFFPLCGEIITAAFLIISTYFFSISPEVTAAVLATIRGITGGTLLFGLGAITYISDITSLEDRAWRLGLITSLTFIGSPLGTALAGVLRSYFGFFNLFVMCTVLNFNALILGVFLVKNSAVEESKLKTFEGICDPSHLILSVKTLFKKRPGYNRLIIWLMGITAPLFIACFLGESTVLYLFVRNKFHMSESEFGFYSAYKLSTVFFGTFISVLICSKFLKLSDEVIGGLGTITQIITAIAMCFVAYTWQLYAFPLMDLMHGAVFTAGRSLTSKVVDGHELGQVNSVFGILDSLISIVAIPLYNAVYNLTIESLPGAFYLLSVVIAKVTFVLFVITWIVRRKEENRETTHF